MPEVSLIVPVYNTAPYLERCLNSIVVQTFQNFEVLCINDGSTDNSLEILERYAVADNRIKIISQENKGLSGARNRGILEGKSSYIMFIDSDDTIEPTMIEELYETMKQADCDIVMGGYKHLDVMGHIQKISPNINTTLSKDELFKKVLTNEVSSSPCICIYTKKIFFENHLFFKNHLFFEDAEFQYKAIFYAKSVHICNSPLYNYYHLNPGSITNSISSKHIEDLFFIFNDMKSFLRNVAIENFNTLSQLRIYNSLKYLLIKISRHAQTTEKTVAILELLWKKASESEEFQILAYSQKIHLIFLTLSLLKDKKHYQFFDFFHLCEQTIHRLQNYTNTPLGLMSGAIEYLVQNNYIKNIYIYGAGEILNTLFPSLEHLNINILGIIDQETKSLTYNKHVINSQSLNETLLKDKDIILIASVSFANEIRTKIKNFSSSKHINIHLIDFLSSEQ